MIYALSRSVQAARTRADALPALATQMFKVLVVLLILIGVFSRVSPLFDIEGRVFWQHMTEDGYLMQTVARNMAIGLGMSSAEGRMATNGVQPLATFVFAALHYVAGGSKVGGISLIMAASVLIGIATLYYGYRLGARALSGLRHGRELALISAALWFVGPRITAHSMNGLETGLYYLSILCTWNYYLGVVGEEGVRLQWRQRLVFGLLLGITFLSRNDAVFFIAALLLAHWLVGGTQGGGFRYRFVDSCVAGIASLVVAAPWLVHNRIRFGSVVPISGSAQSFDAVLGQNLRLMPANLFEAAYPLFPVPGSVEGFTSVAIVATLATLFSLFGFWFFAARSTLSSRRFFTGGLIFVTGIATYYGVFFGAPHFLSRYTSSLSPFLWLCTAATAFGVINLLFKSARGFQVISGAMVATLALFGAGFAYKNFANGRAHMHKQVADWVMANVSPSDWVGAPQTGTLGFFHDRTINLDGKVNPDALKVLLKDGHILNYVLDSKINYIVDWADMADWVNFKQHSVRFGNEFEVVVKDPKLNLAVLRRIQPVAEQP
jgi:hypothetical protein